MFQKSKVMLKVMAPKKTWSMLTTSKDPHIESEWRGGGRGGESSASRAWRLLRWPIALLLCTITLAVSIYVLMPDSMRQSGNDSSNSTIWGASFGGVGLGNRDETKATTLPPGVTKSAASLSNDTNKQTTANDAYVVSGDIKQERPTIFKIVTSSMPKDKKSGAKAPPPVFPTFVAPDVQYGNEKSDDTTIRTAKLQDSVAKQDIVEEESSTLYSTRVEENLKPKFAIYYKDIEHIRNGNNQADRIVHDSEAAGAFDSRPNIVSVVSDYNVNGARRKLNFTSGHSNMFGLSLEEAHRMRSTTDIYSTRVSPTLPAMRDIQYGITTAQSRLNNTEEDAHCESTRLTLCRGALPYDLAAPPSARVGELAAALPLLEYVVQAACSARARPYLCALLEPECAPAGVTPLLPCRSACRAVTEACEDVIAQLASYEAARAFDCRALPVAEAEGGGCVAAGAVFAGGPSGTHCPRGQVPCAVDNSCMPAHWLCDGSPDCPGGTDERNCSACKGNEFRCEADSTCLPSSWVCDGYADCADAADEAHCGLEGPGAAVAASDHRQARARAGTPDKPMSRRGESNGNDADGSKELLVMSDTRAPRPRAPPAFRRPQAPSTPAPTTIPPTTTEQELEEEAEAEADTTLASSGHASPCPPGELRCVDGRCITFSQLCDGYTDCSDGADEGNCYLR